MKLGKKIDWMPLYFRGMNYRQKALCLISSRIIVRDSPHRKSLTRWEEDLNLH